MKIIKNITFLLLILSLSACAAGLQGLSGDNIEIGDDVEIGDTTYLNIAGQEFPPNGTDNIVLDYGAIGLILPDGITIDEDSVSPETFTLSGDDIASTSISFATSVTGSFDYSHEFQCETGPCIGLAFIPGENLAAGARYTVRVVSGENGIRGSNGEILAEDIVWSFTTPRLYFVDSYTDSKFSDAVERSDGRSLVTGYKNLDGSINPWLIVMNEDGSTYAQNTDPFDGMDGRIEVSTIHDGVLYVAGYYDTEVSGAGATSGLGGHLWAGAYNPDTLERIERVTIYNELNVLQPMGIATSDTHLYVAGYGNFNDLEDAFIYEFNLNDLSAEPRTFQFNAVGNMQMFKSIFLHDGYVFVMGYGGITEENQGYILKIDPSNFTIVESITDSVTRQDAKIYRSIELHDGVIYAVGFQVDDSIIHGLISALDPDDLSIIRERRIFDEGIDGYGRQGLHALAITDDGTIYVAGSMWSNDSIPGTQLRGYGFIGKYNLQLTELDSNTFAHDKFSGWDAVYIVADRIVVESSGCVQLFGSTFVDTIYGGNVLIPGGLDAITHPFQIKLDSNLNVGGGTLDLD